jgi:hypothetical protein
VQGDGRLAGARTALYHQDAAEAGADHPVLLGLDRRDDVAHPPGAPDVHGGQQRRLARQTVVRPVNAGLAGGSEVKHLVVQADHPPLLGADLPAPPHPLRRGRGGEVERAGRGRPPVQ